MKLLLLFVAILGVTAVSAVPTGNGLSRSTRGLKEDWADFFALIDTDKVLEICIQYLAEDAEVQTAVAYILSEDFAKLVVAVESIPEYIRFLDYLQAAGLDVYTYVNLLHNILGLSELKLAAPSLSVSRLISTRITGGITGLVADLLAICPLKELRALFDEKLQTSSEFANLVGLLTSPEAQKVYDELKAIEQYQWIRAELVAVGLDVDAFFDVAKSLIGWG